MVLFCKLNNIEHDVVQVRLFKMNHLDPSYEKLNPFKQVPAMKDVSNGGFVLYESHAIMRYLHASRKCEDHWYPKNPK